MRLVIAAAALSALLATPALADNAKIADATKVLQALGKDAAKQKAYCEMQDLFNKSADATDKKNKDEADKLNKQAEEKSKELGDDFQKVMSLEEEINPETPEGKAFFEALEGVEKTCAKK
jgi:hypothetical protein